MEKKPKKQNKKKIQEAEKAGEWYVRHRYKCVTTRRPVRNQFQKVDFFGADVVGKQLGGTHVYLQVTTGSAANVSQRRRKLEAVPWHDSDIVQIGQLVSEQEGRKKNWFFRIHQYRPSSCKRVWYVEEQWYPIPKEWFTAWKEKNNGDK